MKKKFITTGFTLVEILVVVGIIMVLATLSFPIYKNFIAVSQSENTSRDLQETLRRANNKARESHINSQWGVRIDSSSYTLFKGRSWLTRESSYDESHSVQWGISISSALSEIIFTKNGTTTSVGSITVSGANSNTTITINGEGVIDLQ